MSAPTQVEAKQPGTIGELRQVFQDLWAARDLLFQLTRRDITIRYRQAVMGFFWAVLMPLLIVLSGILIRVAMAKYAGTQLDTSNLASIAVKALPWSFFVGAIGFATPSLAGNMNLVTKVYFPREVLTLSTILAQTMDAGIGLAVLSIALPLLGVHFSWSLLWVPVLLALILLLTCAAGLFLACANLFFRDVKYLVQVFVTFGIFFTPVFYEPSLLGARGAQLLLLNPIAVLLEALQVAIIGGHNLLEPLVRAGPGASEVVLWAPWYLGYAAAWALGGFTLSLLFFRRLSYLFAEYI